MTSRLKNLLAGCALAAAVMGLPGCSGDPVTSGTAGLDVRMVPSPGGAGRYETGTFLIRKIDFTPVEPELEALLGGNILTMRFGVFTADLVNPAPQSFSLIALQPGSYRVVNMEVRPPTMIDTNPDAGAVNCIDRVSSVPSGAASAEVPLQYEFDSNDGYFFTVQPGQTVLDIRVDVPGLLADYEALFTCQDSCGVGGAPCLTAFDADGFRAVFASRVTIH